MYRKIFMVKLDKARISVLITILYLLTFCSVGRSADINDEVLNIIVQGVQYNNSLIQNITFDYNVDNDVSEEYRQKQLANKKILYQNIPEGMEIRDPTLEHTIRTGIARSERDKFYITSKIVATSDQKVFQDKIVNYDGFNLTVLNLLENYGEILNELSPIKSDLFFDPRTYPVLFADGRTLHTALTAEDTKSTVTGTEEIDGTLCYKIDMGREFIGFDGIKKTSRRKCWVAFNKGFLVKKAISFSIRPVDIPLSVTQCELTQVADGIWYYSKVTFQSYPLQLPKPDVTVTLTISNVVVNQVLKEDAFNADFNKVGRIHDRITGITYTTH